MARHIMIDIEASGPPHHGTMFALAAVRFDLDGIASQESWKIRNEGMLATGSTLAWLSEQSPEVLAQLRGGKPFDEVYSEFISWAYMKEEDDDDDMDVYVWANDYTDFAWLSGAAHKYGRSDLRDFDICQLDSTALIRLANAPEPTEHRGIPFVTHIALDDATQQALHLIASLAKLGLPLPWFHRATRGP